MLKHSFDFGGQWKHVGYVQKHALKIQLQIQSESNSKAAFHRN